MNNRSLLAAVALALSLAACSSASTGAGTSGASGTAGTGGATGTSGGGGGGFGALTGNGGSATCDDACAHYLTCKGAGWDTPQNRSTCDQSCTNLGASADQLASFVAADCASAVAAIDGPGTSSGGTTSGGTGTSSASSTSGGADCNGCVWDGSSCIYLTGSGGNYFACGSSCCPGH